MREPVRRIVVVGRDLCLWYAAGRLRRTFGPAGIEVVAVELPGTLSAHHSFVVPPSGQLAQMCPDMALMRDAAGAPLMGHRFEGWQPDLPGFMRPMPGGASRDEVLLRHLWTNGRREGLGVPFGDMFEDTACAATGRVLKSRFALAVDAIALARTLAAVAIASGVQGRRATGVSPTTDGDRIARLTLDDGTAIEGDLFVDASGADAVLASALGAVRRVSAEDGLLPDRMLVASAPPMRTQPSHALVQAGAAGWTSLTPVRGRVAAVAAYSTATDTGRSAASMLAAVVPDPGPDFVDVDMPGGSLDRCWIGNCVAVGDTALGCDPLLCLDARLLDATIDRLVALMPSDRGFMPEADWYSRHLARLAIGVGDFRLAHYTAAAWWRRGNAGGTFPDLTDTLEHRLELFADAGMVAEPSDLPNGRDWSALLLGMGLLPVRRSPMIDRLPAERQMMLVRDRLQEVAATVRAMPDAGDFIEGRLAGDGG